MRRGERDTLLIAVSSVFTYSRRLFRQLVPRFGLSLGKERTMMPSCRLRFSAWTWVLLGLSLGQLLLPADAIAQPAPERATGTGEKAEFFIFRLKHIKASEASRIVRDLLGS